MVIKGLIFLLAVLLVISSAEAEPISDPLIGKAQSRDPVAQEALGLKYMRKALGRIQSGTRATTDDQQIIELALKWLRAAAEQGMVDSQLTLGRLYYEGKLVKLDEFEAAKWLRKVADRQNGRTTASAQYMLGMIFYKGDCEGDYYPVPFRCIETGFFVPHGYEYAANWFRKAARSGNAEANYQLATMFETGRGVIQDYAEASRLFRAAIEAGDDQARGPLGQLFVRMRDYVSAHMWFNLAASAGDLRATKYRDDLAKLMEPAQIATAQELARAWDEKHKRPPLVLRWKPSKRSPD